MRHFETVAMSGCAPDNSIIINKLDKESLSRQCALNAASGPMQEFSLTTGPGNQALFSA
jgi:hypothetical protein